jgi:hypothetical protein
VAVAAKSAALRLAGGVVKRPAAGPLREPLKPHTGREVLGRHPRYVYRRFGGGCLRAGGPTPGALRRNQGGLRAGGICAGQCQGRRRPFFGLHRARHAGNAATAPGQQTFATDRSAARRRLQSAESELRPAYCAAIASGSATRGGEPTPATRDPASRARAANQ